MVPKLSVIIPVYQDQLGLDRCLVALSKQSGFFMSDLEVIVVDNSPEPTITLPKDLPYKIKLLRCKKKGAYSARNRGVGAATADAFAFLDADCWPDRNWARVGLEALYGSEKGAILGGEVLFEQSIHPTIVESYQALMGFGQKRSIEEFEFSATANLFVSRKIFGRVGLFNEALLSGGDREWSWRARSLGIPLQFIVGAVVWTEPRKSLKAAFVQARRVSGGRIGLEKDAELVATIGLDKIQPGRGLVRKSKAILFARDLPVVRRLKVLVVALLIKIVHDFERVRLRLGGDLERR
ncbi:glycosyltransferase family 2 protein [Methylophaga sp.]|uniref:glycosyltransferase family 2 protein n=1 Tax=Methylophaga sp. TaxID=2024840 RepID=UPI003A924D3F